MFKNITTSQVSAKTIALEELRRFMFTVNQILMIHGPLHILKPIKTFKMLFIILFVGAK